MRQSNYRKIAPKIPPRTLLEYHIGRGLTFMELSRICGVPAAALRAGLAFYELTAPPSPQRSEARRVQLRAAGYSWEQIAIISPETEKTIYKIGKIRKCKLDAGHKLQLRQLAAARKLYSIRWCKQTAAEIAALPPQPSLLSKFANGNAGNPGHSYSLPENGDEF